MGRVKPSRLLSFFPCSFSFFFLVPFLRFPCQTLRTIFGPELCILKLIAYYLTDRLSRSANTTVYLAFYLIFYLA